MIDELRQAGAGGTFDALANMTRQRTPEPPGRPRTSPKETNRQLARS